MNDERDDGFDRRIHDAYESVSLSPEAEGRILGALLAAQAEHEAAGEPAMVLPESDASTTETPLAEILPGPSARRRSPLRVALPVAACLAAAVLVTRALVPGATSKDTMLSASVALEEVAEETVEEAEDVSADYDALDADATAEDAMPAEDEKATSGVDAGGMTAEGAVEEADGTAWSDWEEFAHGAEAWYVVTADGVRADVVISDGEPVAVEASLVKDELGPGEAWDAYGTSLGDAAAYRLVDGSGLAGDCAVRLEGDETYYLAVLDD